MTDVDRAIKTFNRTERQRREHMADCADELLKALELLAGAVGGLPENAYGTIQGRDLNGAYNIARTAIAHAKGEQQ